MKQQPQSLNYRLRSFMLPGLKRWMLIIFFGIAFIILGVFLLLGYHPITVSGQFLRDVMEHAADLLPHRISGLIIITVGGFVVCVAIARMTLSVLGAYLPNDRESIPDVLYRKRHLERGPRVVVIGGGTGLSNLLKGLKSYTNNITAIVTVGDDGGSSGRLRQEMGVLPPGDIRNCITALADEDKLVTELFRYRFQTGQGLEGHSFGNLFLTAICDITHGDMLEAVKVASKVLNSCGTVVPSTLTSITLIATMEDGRSIEGESKITHAGGKITRIQTKPELNMVQATPEALQAIEHADLIILGPGSLYTSIIPNLLVQGIPQAICRSTARKLYVSNVMTQMGETIDYTVADHIDALLLHAQIPKEIAKRFIQTVLVNDEVADSKTALPVAPVRFDKDRVKGNDVAIIERPLADQLAKGHHDPNKLAKEIMDWYSAL